MTSPPSDQSLAKTVFFFSKLGVSETLPAAAEKKDFFSDLIRSILTVDSIDRGRIVCTLTVNSAVTNPYNTLHGGAVAAVAEAVALACARTVVGEELFLGELSNSYLAAARIGMEVEVDGSILRQGRRVIVTSVEFKTKKTRHLIYTSRATFYVMPVARL
ncbi:uncharacterized protein [Typha angustifolia]|uniref:uncharacterized protein n=1 Tax=Typha angustifolia TaxID=59011 RepID=UPI003C2E7AB3